MGMRQAAMAEMARRELAKRSQAKTSRPEIIEETHPEISVSDRLIVKNLSQSPEKSAQFLKKEHPGLDTRVFDGRVLVKDKNSTKWNPIDPDADGFDGFGELAADIGDIGFDVLSTGAEIGGAALAGGSTFGAGTIAGAAGGAAISEAARQGLGKLAGLDVDLGEAAKDTLIAGTIGGAIPGLGKVAAPLVKGAATGAKGIVRGLTEATGKDIDVFVNKGADLDSILKSETGFTDVFRGIQKEVAEKEKAFKKSLGDEFNKLRESGIEVDIDSARGLYDDKLSQLKATAQTDADDALVASLQKERDQLFSRTTPKVEPSQAEQLAARIEGRSASATGGKQDIPIGQDIERVLNLREQLSARANFKGKANLDKSLDSASLSEGLAARGFGELGESIDNVVGQIDSKKVREQFKDHIEFVTEISKNFKTVDAVESFAKASSKGGRKALAEKVTRIDKRFNTNISGKFDVISTAQALAGQTGDKISDISLRPKSFLEVMGIATGAKLAWAAGQPALIPVAIAGGAAIGRKLGSIKAARKYVDFIVDAEGRALNIEKSAQELLKKKVFRSITGQDALRESVKLKAKLNDERG